MDLGFLGQGLLLGFSIAAPVGPIGLLCIQRTLARGRVYGLVSGLGAATADAFYGAVAGFGLTVVSGLLVSQATLLRLGGGLFLCYLGAHTVLAAPATRSAAAVTATGYLQAYTSTVVLTLSNPLTILSFTAIFAGLGLAGRGQSGLAGVALVAGVFLGSAAW